jgi:hypothetical protein
MKPAALVSRDSIAQIGLFQCGFAEGEPGSDIGISFMDPFEAGRNEGA